MNAEWWAVVVAGVGLPVTAIAKVVSLSKDVEANKASAEAALEAHAKLDDVRIEAIKEGFDRIVQELQLLRAEVKK